jgi:Family of unknown function (DUF6599)
MFTINMSRARIHLFQLSVAYAAILTLLASASGATEVTATEAAKSLPDQVANLHATGTAGQPLKGLAERALLSDFNAVSDAARIYQNESGDNVTIEVVRAENDASAFALLMHLVADGEQIKTDSVGTANILSAGRIIFYQGNNLVRIETSPKMGEYQLLAIAKAFSDTLPKGDDEIPVLVQHLPNGQTVLSHAFYAVTLKGLQAIVPNQPILDAVDFEGGTEAVAANYGSAQLLIVEFTTPQFAAYNDQKITPKTQELRSQGQPSPTAYRRVGNYSVFVFNASDEQTANKLIDQVKYQKVVQWLGEDPHLYEKMERYLTNTTSEVLVAVLESSGLSLLICVGLGGLLGTLLFRHRRAQQAALYSDAGGSVRLNLDELSSTNKTRLLSPGDQVKHEAPRS